MTYRDHKIVASIFCGRQDRTPILLRYLQILYDRKLIDEVHLWDYTRDLKDTQWIRSMGLPTLYTSNRYEYACEYPAEQELSMRVKAKSDICILLKDDQTTTYEIIIGKNKNTKSLVKHKQGYCSTVLVESDIVGFGNDNDWNTINIVIYPTIVVTINGVKWDTDITPKNSLKTVQYSTGFGSKGVWDFPNFSKTPFRYCKPLKNKEVDVHCHWSSYYSFYYDHRETLFGKAVLLKIDDDVLCLDIDHFGDFLDFRIDNPDYFLVFSNTINNGTIAYYQQQTGTIPTSLMELELPPGGLCGSLWESADKCVMLHDYFLNNPSRFSYEGYQEIEPTLRVSINMFSVLTKHLEYYESIKDDERELSVDIPTRCNFKKAIYTGFYSAHFTFYSQENTMSVENRNRLLNAYESFSQSE